jgi:tetratricopeptide (TPR) repeat protein
MRTIVAVLVLAMVAGCASDQLRQGRHLAEQGRYEQAVDTLYSYIDANPKSAPAWRELGVVFYENGDLTKAEDALLQANNIAPDSRTNLYLGMTFEKAGNIDRAIDAYQAALGLNPGSRTRDMIQAHLNELMAQKIRQEVSTSLTNEAAIKADTIPDNTIAVVDFDNSRLPADLAPLSKGLAEFTAADLSKVKSLRVVERQKLDFLLKEMKLASSEYANPAYSPRLGRLMGSRHIVTGSLMGVGDKEFRMDGAVVSTADSSAKPTSPTEGTLDRFFQVQKEFVFKVIDNLGITLTPQERDSIQKVPTESFLAFMAYCRGLDYQSRGMMDQARQEYRQAAAADNKFIAARQQVKTLSLPAPTAPGAPGSLEQLESSAGEESGGDQSSTGLDQFQAGTLDRTGFIKDLNNLDEFGNPSDAPPRTGKVTMTGTIIIQGDLDARP